MATTEYSEQAFIELANNGFALHQDRSTAIETNCLGLTLDEIDERKAWNVVRKALHTHYATVADPVLQTVDEVVNNHRVPPPLMGIDNASQRTAASG